jgi:hypothetical protein
VFKVRRFIRSFTSTLVQTTKYVGLKKAILSSTLEWPATLPALRHSRLLLQKGGWCSTLAAWFAFLTCESEPAVVSRSLLGTVKGSFKELGVGKLGKSFKQVGGRIAGDGDSRRATGDRERSEALPSTSKPTTFPARDSRYADTVLPI